MNSTFNIRPATLQDREAVAELIFDSTNDWYVAHGKDPVFNCERIQAALFFDVYESLDPSCCVIAVDERSGGIAGSCFYHPRPTHVSLGIMNSKSSYSGKGVARKLLNFVVEYAAGQGKPVRLVSSAMNLDSFSLYNRAGFVPFAVYQDLVLSVPQVGLRISDSDTGVCIRDAALSDVPSIVEMEQEVHGVCRPDDWRYFIKNESGDWHVSLAEDKNGSLVGSLASICHPASSMLGPGCMRNDGAAVSLIEAELNFRRGQTMVWLVPSNRQAIVQAMYSIGAKNCELHFGQVLGEVPKIDGVVMPTFMPETA